MSFSLFVPETPLPFLLEFKNCPPLYRWIQIKCKWGVDVGGKGDSCTDQHVTVTTGLVTVAISMLLVPGGKLR